MILLNIRVCANLFLSLGKSGEEWGRPHSELFALAALMG